MDLIITSRWLNVFRRDLLDMEKDSPKKKKNIRNLGFCSTPKLFCCFCQRNRNSSSLRLWSFSPWSELTRTLMRRNRQRVVNGSQVSDVAPQKLTAAARRCRTKNLDQLTLKNTVLLRVEVLNVLNFKNCQRSKWNVFIFWWLEIQWKSHGKVMEKSWNTTANKV